MLIKTVFDIQTQEKGYAICDPATQQCGFVTYSLPLQLKQDSVSLLMKFNNSSIPEMNKEELIFRFTLEEVKVLQALIEFHSGSEIPDWLSEDAYDSVFDKVMSN
jgi:hypothetical protein